METLCHQIDSLSLQDNQTLMMKMLSEDLDLLAYDYCLLRDPEHLVDGRGPYWDFHFCQGIKSQLISFESAYQWFVSKILHLAEVHQASSNIQINHEIVNKYLTYYLNGFWDWHG